MEILVIGAGVVGLAIARELAIRGHSVVVCEATGGIGNGVSSRNSEVIHGGMYYPQVPCAPAIAWKVVGCSTRSARATAFPIGVAAS